ncbi:MAG: hypothetical protein H7249_05965, partial [Chitinophagaceae bacterium]|nr:hypothetical protein [Oligoflexus sp.]
FFILMDNFVPPFIPGAEIDSLTEILDCPNGALMLTKYNASSLYERPCEGRIHRWNLAYYKVTH